MIVIFDLDGTVWDSEEGIVGSLEHTFSSFGMETPERSVLTANVGPPLQLMLAELGIPAELIDDATLRYRQRYVEWGAYQASLYPGVLGRDRRDRSELVTGWRPPRRRARAPRTRCSSTSGSPTGSR